jgi:NhaP-type Na+/H+ and K+/H+ antiporter
VYEAEDFWGMIASPDQTHARLTTAAIDDGYAALLTAAKPLKRSTVRMVHKILVVALNRVALPQGLHAPFVTTAALVIFGGAQIVHGSGFLAVYLAGIIIGNRPTRAHNSVVTFLDAATWLAQIVMFVLLGLLVSPHRLTNSIGPAVIVALV